MERITNYSWGYAAGMLVIFGVWILLGMLLGVIGILYMILSEHIKDKMKEWGKDKEKEHDGESGN